MKNLEQGIYYLPSEFLYQCWNGETSVKIWFKNVNLTIVEICNFFMRAAYTVSRHKNYIIQQFYNRWL